MSGGPLAGFRILEVSHMLAGPYAGMLLADLGAEVIKVETGSGDIARETGQHYVNGHNCYFASLNRNKKSVRIDLDDSADREIFRALVRTAHGLITNLRPQAIRKLGLTYEALKVDNPKLACVAITGFGLQGPQSDYPAYDYIIQAMAGVMMLTGEPDGPPMRAGYSVVDNTGGMMAVIGLLAKLTAGVGGQVEVALYDAVLSQLNYLASAYLNAHEEPVRQPSGGHSIFVPAQIFETANGYVALFITHDRFWRILADGLGRPEWLVDERFATMAARSSNRGIVVEAVGAELRKQSSDHWVSQFRPLGLVIAKVRSVADALDAEQLELRSMLAEIPQPGQALRLIANPIKISGFAERYEAPPRLGEHDREYRTLVPTGCSDES